MGLKIVLHTPYSVLRSVQSFAAIVAGTRHQGDPCALGPYARSRQQGACRWYSIFSCLLLQNGCFPEALLLSSVISHQSTEYGVLGTDTDTGFITGSWSGEQDNLLFRPEQPRAAQAGISPHPSPSCQERNVVFPRARFQVSGRKSWPR